MSILSKPCTPGKPRAKPRRSVKLVFAPTEEQPGIVEIQVGNERKTYSVTPLVTDFGLGFRLEEPGQTPYDVLLADWESLCECKGFLKHGQCKHVLSLATLVHRGKIGENEGQCYWCGGNGYVPTLR